ncbi:pyridoxal-phosphate dependent enzyme (plasmid) [Halorussus limi]|uniref:Pyridoxal-phosphate dependent enzyme n=1 Tax=Halorussus limi TaxID=2938695 RepID=A0A8U0I0R5_9EURY|nr:pyridoxal-phosphate dependent enzyme [Halorussus limi]UPV76496.1 pyridoxal-phosphate dependent enzyme [Halorussus limi]
MTGDSPEIASDSRDLTCYRCGANAAFPDRKRCDCGEPLWFDTDAAAEAFAWPDAGTGVSRYADLLPVETGGDSRTDGGVSAAAGSTPLVRASGLDADAGCRLWLKDESENPTGSFKDRGSAVGVAWAARAGREWVGTVSHGNMAMSVAANAAGVGGSGSPRALVLVPDDISEERLAAIAQYDPELVRVAGDYGRLYRETLDADAPVEFVNSDTPLRVAGQKTTALEICEAFAAETRTRTKRAPDAIVLPVSSGGHASATWKALRELRTAGLFAAADLPRLYFVQAAACDPIAAAYRDGNDSVMPADDAGDTVAYSIANADPPSGTRALAAARATDGAVLSVPDDEILDAKATLASEAGFCVEPASATTLAGIRRLADSGELDADDDVVAVLTGTGFRELDAGSATTETVALGDLSERLRALTA